MAKEISLDIAISEIKQACDRAKKKGHCPFFFIVGAGISSPPVPLATEIIKDCKEKAVEFNRKVDAMDPEKSLPIDLYSYYFRTAYPQPADRQEYLRELIEKKQISAANLRLAHLLLSKKLATMAVTPNFDDFLSRSLNLFGFPFIICDHPRTVERINILNKEIQIAHVHGTYWFYDCCNLRSEIEDRAESSKENVFSMASLLDQILTYHSPLVVGYSGWEGDVIMSALKRRLKIRLPYNLYWFCYRREDMDSLPEELREHGDVYFVLPQKETSGDETGGAAKDEPSFIPKKEKRLAEKAKEGARLPADVVFEGLIKAFKIPQPDLTRDPLGFMAKTLRESFLTEEKEKDIYFFDKVIEQVEKAKNLLEENTKEMEVLFENLRDLMRRSQYKQTIREGAKIELKKLDTPQLYEIFSIIWSASTKLFDNSEEELMGYDRLIEIGERLIRNRRFKKDVSIKMASSILYKGFTLRDLGKSQEAIAAYDEVVKRFGDSKEPRIQVNVARAMANKGVALGVLGKSQEAIAAYDEVVKRFGDSKEPDIQVKMARAMVNKGYTLGVLGKSQEEIAAYDEVVKRFGDSKEPNIQVRVASALVNKGVALGVLGKSQEAIAIYDEVVKRFGDSKEPAIKEPVGNAFGGIGYRLLIEAKQSWSQKEESKFKDALLKAVEKIDESLQYYPDEPITLGNKAYASFLLGDLEAATNLLAKAIALGGEKVQEGELKDADTHPLPYDEKFKALVKSIQPQKN